jgi:hypothetical protein
MLLKAAKGCFLPALAWRTSIDVLVFGPVMVSWAEKIAV